MTVVAAKQFLLDDRVKGWLQPAAAEIFLRLAPTLDIEGKPVSEIGVHHGRSAIFLGLLSGGRLVGYDLFNRQSENVDRSGRGDYERFVENCELYGIKDDRLVVREVNSLELSPEQILEDCGEAPSIFSVDGGHTIEITKHDLMLSAEVSADAGVVVLDDFFNARFPEVSMGTVDFFKEHPNLLFPFCIAGGKVFFTRSRSVAAEYRSFLAAIRPFRFENIVNTTHVEFFGHETFCAWSYIRKSELRKNLTQTRLWRAIRDTHTGRFVKKIYWGSKAWRS